MTIKPRTKWEEERFEYEAYKRWKSVFGVNADEFDKGWQMAFRCFPYDYSQLKAVRKCLMYTSDFIAKKLGINREALIKIEQREIEGRITLMKMHQVAEALDCELIIRLKPKNGEGFCKTLWTRLLKELKRPNHEYTDPTRLASDVGLRSKRKDSMEKGKINRQKFYFRGLCR